MRWARCNACRRLKKPYMVKLDADGTARCLEGHFIFPGRRKILTKENLAMLLDKYVDSIIEMGNKFNYQQSPTARRTDTKSKIRDFTLESLNSLLEEISVYGKNTHVYSSAEAFIIELKRIL